MGIKISTGSFLPPPELRWGNKIVMEYLRVPDLKRPGEFLGPDWPRDHLGIETRGLFGQFVQTEQGIRFFKPPPEEGGICEDEMLREAARCALANGGVEAGEVDAVFIASCTPRIVNNFCGQHLRRALGMLREMGIKTGRVLYTNEGCGAPAVLLELARQALACHDINVVLLLAANAPCDYMARRELFVSPGDPRKIWAPLSLQVFGSGASGMVLRKVSGGDSGFLAVQVNRDETVGLVEQLDDQTIVMDPKMVARVVKTLMPQTFRALLAQADLRQDQVRLLVFHQLNGKVPREVGRELGMPDECVPSIAGTYGNLAAASTFTALDLAMAEGKVNEGDVVVVVAVGGGMGATSGGGAFLG